MDSPVSGDVILVDDPAGGISRLLVTAKELFSSDGFLPAALVGGLAVTCRIQTAHRATTDVDTVTEGEAPGEHLLEYLADNTAARRVTVHGVKVDTLATYPLPAQAGDLPEDDHDRLFVLGHRWALETAGPLTVHAQRPDGDVVTAELTVATAPALLACKLHAIAGRPAARRDKKESDARDIYRLSRLLVQDPGHGFGAAPFDLKALVASGVTRWLIDDATRTTALINLSAGSGDPFVDRDDLLTSGELLTERLR